MAESVSATSNRPYALVVHGGAGGHHWNMSDAKEMGFRAGLRAAFDAGEAVLAGGGSALDAACAAVVVLEEDPLFNSGYGASLTSAGTVEHDACVMTGDGHGGAVALSRRVRNPILLARAIIGTPEALIADPDDAYVASLGLELVDNDWFITDERRARLASLQDAGGVGLPAPQDATRAKGTDLPAHGSHKHGTVGCVALDAHGHLAAATSTGGYDNKPPRRVGDTPIFGAGTWAKDGVVAVSCTGRGESFILGGVAHQVSARMEYGHQDAVAAATATIDAEITARGTMGALIAVTADGRCVLAWDSPTLLACWRDGDEVVIRI